jgi:CheY-like chemotaxis protein
MNLDTPLLCRGFPLLFGLTRALLWGAVRDLLCPTAGPRPKLLRPGAIMNTSPAADRPIKVLVIDDVPDTAETLAEFLLQGYGFDARVAHDGQAGLEAVQADHPVAVVCDLGLPRVDGLEVARRIRDTISPCPLLIAVTGRGDAFPEEEAVDAFDFYAVKPANPYVIAALIERAAAA